MSRNQQQNGTSSPSGSSGSGQGKLMNQMEYAKYKQEMSNANNFYEFSSEATTLPVAWDGKFVSDPNNTYVVPNRNASSVSNFYGFCTEPDIRPVKWDGTFAKSGETYTKQERNRSNDQKYF
jgi:hypothetical protein